MAADFLELLDLRLKLVQKLQVKPRRLSVLATLAHLEAAKFLNFF